MTAKNNKVICDEMCVHPDAVQRAKDALQPDEILNHLAEFFKVYGDFTRLKILCALSTGELCVCDIAAITGMSESAVSHQLRILRNTRLAKFRRDGRSVYYSLDDTHVSDIIRTGLEHVCE